MATSPDEVITTCAVFCMKLPPSSRPVPRPTAAYEHGASNSGNGSASNACRRRGL